MQGLLDSCRKVYELLKKRSDARDPCGRGHLIACEAVSRGKAGVIAGMLSCVLLLFLHVFVCWC
jgi:hypothetical protein